MRRKSYRLTYHGAIYHRVVAQPRPDLQLPHTNPVHFSGGKIASRWPSIHYFQGCSDALGTDAAAAAADAQETKIWELLEGGGPLWRGRRGFLFELRPPWTLPSLAHNTVMLPTSWRGRGRLSLDTPLLLSLLRCFLLRRFGDRAPPEETLLLSFGMGSLAGTLGEGEPGQGRRGVNGWIIG